MNEIIMLPTTGRKSLNLQEFAEDAIVVEDTIIRTPSNLHFIEANTLEVDLNHLTNETITPVFAKDNWSIYNLLLLNILRVISQKYGHNL